MNSSSYAVGSFQAVDKEELQRLGKTKGSGDMDRWEAISARKLVPKRRLVGGTFKLAHRLAIPILTAIILLLVVLVLMGWLMAANFPFTR